ncbi:hypothetical protein ABIA33_007197 [Streptacidiphilus sp. MAP12-16]|uniref:DUF742 domain-containing protein n=1 Tax=Streptacidiphilus sp. MAP12-16 TaxID=3156300 RepID=UPI003518902C
MSGPHSPGRRLVPAYLATAGSARPSRNTVDRITIVAGASRDVPEGLGPAQHRIAQLLQSGSLTVVEVAAYLRLPVSVVKVLVSELVDSGHLLARAPVPPAGRYDRQLLERVLSGLRAVRG